MPGIWVTSKIVAVSSQTVATVCDEHIAVLIPEVPASAGSKFDSTVAKQIWEWLKTGFESTYKNHYPFYIIFQET